MRPAASQRTRTARFLVRAGIDSISVTPDSFFAVKQNVAAAEDDPALGAGGARAPQPLPVLG